MSKVTKNENKELQTVEQAATALIPSAETMDDGFVMPEASEFLPRIQFIYPIMQTPDHPELDGQEWTLGFKQGTEFVRIPTGSTIVCVDKRNVIRVNKDDGSDGKDYAYAALERGGKVYGQSDEQFKALREAGEGDLGVSTVCAIIFPDKSVVVAEFPAWTTVQGYLMNLVCAAAVQRGQGLKLLIDNHKQNLTKSKAGRYYPDAKKFKQWERVALTAEQLSAIRDAVNDKTAGFMNWLNR